MKLACPFGRSKYVGLENETCAVLSMQIAQVLRVRRARQDHKSPLGASRLGMRKLKVGFLGRILFFCKFESGIFFLGWAAAETTINWTTLVRNQVFVTST